MRHRSLRAARLLPCVLLVACGGGEGPRLSEIGSQPPDVVIFLIDTLRADWTQPNGFDRETTPNLQALAAEGVVLEQAHAAGPWTLPSVVSLFTGKHLVEHNVVHDRLELPESATTLAELRAAFNDAIWGLLLIVIILGGILSGMFTPTESAAVAVIYTFLISGFLYRTLKWRELWRPLVDTAMVSSGIMLIVAMASMVSFVFAFESIPARIAGAMMQLTSDKTMLLLLINGFLLLLGMFLEPIAAMILSMPVLITVVHALHMDLTHFGMIVVLNLVIGLATPPVGLCLFIVCSIGRVPFEQVSRASLPMLGICVVVLLLVTFFPDLVLFIPHLFLGPER